MMASSTGWLILLSGIVTSVGGLAAFLSPGIFLRLTVGDQHQTKTTMFFVRHWGVLIFTVGAMIAYSAYVPAVRLPILAGASVEKFAVGLLVFFGRLTPTRLMTAVAIGDGILAILYVCYLS
jgi:hypothetical protein